MTNNDIQALELTINQAKEKIAFKDALEKLESNGNFKKIVLEGYFKDEAIRLVHLKNDPSANNPAIQEKIMKNIDAIGVFRQYLLNIQHTGIMAQKAIIEAEETKNEIYIEEATISNEVA